MNKIRPEIFVKGDILWTNYFNLIYAWVITVHTLLHVVKGETLQADTLKMDFTVKLESLIEPKLP